MQEIEKAYTQYAKEVYRYLLSLSHSEDLAEELTQETFFRAMRTIHSYDGSCKPYGSARLASISGISG